MRVTWTAGRQAEIYTVQGERGAIIARDDDLEVVTLRPTTGRSGELTRRVDRLAVSSACPDSGHTNWFNRIFDRFVDAIENHEYAGEHVRDACRCVAINEACASTAKACVEAPLAASRGFERRDSHQDHRCAPSARDHASDVSLIARAGLTVPGARRRG